MSLLDTLLDQKLIGRPLWEHGNKLFRGVKQFFWFGRLINIMVFPAESFIAHCKSFRRFYGHNPHARMSKHNPPIFTAIIADRAVEQFIYTGYVLSNSVIRFAFAATFAS